MYTSQLINGKSLEELTEQENEFFEAAKSAPEFELYNVTSFNVPFVNKLNPNQVGMLWYTKVIFKVAEHMAPIGEHTEKPDGNKLSLT